MRIYFFLLAFPLDFPLFLVLSADARCSQERNNFLSQFALRQSFDVYTRFWAKIQDFLEFRASSLRLQICPPRKILSKFCYENPTKIPKVTIQKTREKSFPTPKKTSTPKINSKIFLRLWLSPFCAYKIKFIFSHYRNPLQQ